jgi:hypothetical protein
MAGSSPAMTTPEGFALNRHNRITAQNTAVLHYCDLCFEIAIE